MPARTAATQVRLIMRDMTGKNVWDYTLLHGSLTSDIEHHRHNGKLISCKESCRVFKQRKRQILQCFGRMRNGVRGESEKGGGGAGKETFAENPLDFENPDP